MKFLPILSLLAFNFIFLESQRISMHFNRLAWNQIFPSQNFKQSNKTIKNCMIYIVRTELKNFQDIHKEVNNIDYLKFKCIDYIREYNLKRKEENEQQKMENKQIKEDEIYRSRLVSLIGSSVLKDFFAMRY